MKSHPRFKARHTAAGATFLALALLVAANAQDAAKPAVPANSSAPAPLETTVAPPAPVIVPANLFTVPEGLEVTVWATSPMLYNPTNIDFDEEGRLYVAEGVNYRGQGRRRPEGDRIVVLEDTTGAGQADKSTVFVQEPNFVAPLGVAVMDNKIVASQPPDLIVYTDVNRDGVSIRPSTSAKCC